MLEWQKQDVLKRYLCNNRIDFANPDLLAEYLEIIRSVGKNPFIVYGVGDYASGIILFEPELKEQIQLEIEANIRRFNYDLKETKSGLDRLNIALDKVRNYDLLID